MDYHVIVKSHSEYEILVAIELLEISAIPSEKIEVGTRMMNLKFW